MANQVCKFCGANIVRNPKTGKDFCENKCWLNKDKTAPTTQRQVSNYQPKPEVSPEVWEAKDRLQAGMSALKAAATVNEATGKPADEIEKIADSHYKWLMTKKTLDF